MQMSTYSSGPVLVRFSTVLASVGTQRPNTEYEIDF